MDSMDLHFEMLLGKRFRRKPGNQVIIGTQGGESIIPDELIDRWQTSQADIITGINARVRRVYLR
jgi:hypothetical protein